jgi:DNA uptake protein ComE-like DNA-binding protein
MNSRNNNNPVAAAKVTPAGPIKADNRLLVLLALGLLIICIHLRGSISDIELCLPENSQEESIVWLAGADIPDGLYRIPLQPLSQQKDPWQSIYTSLGLYLQENTHGANTTFTANQINHNIAGRRLENASPPLAISPPAKIYPFFFQPLPINEADSELLATIPGIGPQLADRIITLRQKKSYLSSAEQLLEVSGISHVKLKKITKYLAFN